MDTISRPVILGISGLIGLHIWQSLRQRFPQTQVLGIARHPEKIPVNDWSQYLKTQSLDLLQPGQLRQALKIYQPDVVFHAATYYPTRNLTPRSEIQTHLSAFFSQCHEIEQARPRVVVLTSTIGTIPRRIGTTQTDERSFFLDPPQVSAYHYVKVQFERIFLNVFRNHPSIRAVIVNPGMVIAPHDPKPFAFNFLLRVAARKIPAIVNRTMLLVSGKDVGQGHLQAALQGIAGERYILGSDQMMLADFFDHAYQYLHYVKRPATIPLWVAMLTSTLSERWAWFWRSHYPGLPKIPLYQLKYGGKYTLAKAQQQLGFEPRAFLPELYPALDWARSQVKLAR